MEELVRQQLVQMNGAIQALIAGYLTWYTAFWALNAAAIAWIFAKTIQSDHHPAIQRRIAIFFAFMDFAGAITSLWLLLALRDKSQQMVELTHAACRLLEDKNGIATDPIVSRILATNIYPSGFVLWSLLVNALTLVVMGIVWISFSHPSGGQTITRKTPHRLTGEA